MLEQLALFIRWRISFSSFLGAASAIGGEPAQDEAPISIARRPWFQVLKFESGFS
jgi:hypothetical protein